MNDNDVPETLLQNMKRRIPGSGVRHWSGASTLIPWKVFNLKIFSTQIYIWDKLNVWLWCSWSPLPKLCISWLLWQGFTRELGQFSQILDFGNLLNFHRSGIYFCSQSVTSLIKRCFVFQRTIKWHMYSHKAMIYANPCTSWLTSCPI